MFKFNLNSQNDSAYDKICKQSSLEEEKSEICSPSKNPYHEEQKSKSGI